MVYVYSFLLTLIGAPPALAETNAESDEQAASGSDGDLGDRVVEESWLYVTDASPYSYVNDFEQRVLDAGGREMSRSVSQSDGDIQIDVTWHIPEHAWPALRRRIAAMPDTDFETTRLLADEIMGEGSSVVALSIDVSNPYEPEAYFQIGPTIGITAPIAERGLGLGQPIGARALFDRDFSVDAAYAPALGEEPWMLAITMGAATCSELLGYCERSFLNPFLGARVGYAWRGESWALLQAEAGLELLHLGGFIWEVTARPTVALKKGEAALGLDASTAVLIPF